jgi:TonB family protein
LNCGAFRKESSAPKAKLGAAPKLAQKPYDPYVPSVQWTHEPGSAPEMPGSGAAMTPPAAPSNVSAAENLPRFQPPERKGNRQPPVSQTRNYRRFVAIGLTTAGLVLVLAAGWYGRNRFQLYAGRIMGSFESLTVKFMSSEKSSSPHQQMDSNAGKARLSRWSRARLHDSENDAGFAPEDSPANGGQPVSSQALALQLHPTPAAFAVVPSPRSPMRVQVAPRVSLAMLLAQVDPVYPPEARRQRIEGTVTLKAVIGEDGTVRSLQAVSGPELLVSATIDAVRQWRYRPYLVDGRPLEVETIIFKDFHLADTQK